MPMENKSKVEITACSWSASLYELSSSSSLSFLRGRVVLKGRDPWRPNKVGDTDAERAIGPLATVARVRVDKHCFDARSSESCLIPARLIADSVGKIRIVAFVVNLWTVSPFLLVLGVILILYHKPRKVNRKLATKCLLLAGSPNLSYLGADYPYASQWKRTALSPDSLPVVGRTSNRRPLTCRISLPITYCFRPISSGVCLRS
jgi:hypothetical protein